MTTSPSGLTNIIRNALASDMTVDITTIGRRSGEASRIEIWFLNVAGAIYITGSVGRRDWFANLIAEPEFIFHLKESVIADLRATAVVVTDREERTRVFGVSTARWYLEQGDTLEELLDDAPMVRVEWKR